MCINWNSRKLSTLFFFCISHYAHEVLINARVLLLLLLLLLLLYCLSQVQVIRALCMNICQEILVIQLILMMSSKLLD